MHSHRALAFLFVFATTILLGATDATQFNKNNHVRMIKKRALVVGTPAPKETVPVIGVGADPNQNQRPTDGFPFQNPKGSATASAGASSASAQPTDGGGLSISLPPIDSILGGVTGTPSQTASVANASDSSSLPASSTSISQAQATSSTPDSNSVSAPVNTPVAGPASQALTTVLSTENSQPTGDTSSPQANAAGATSQSTHIAKTTIIIIAAIGGGIALIAIIWTVIRKTKFRPSDEFEDRLNPINWDPSSTNPDLMTERPQPGAGLYRSNSRGSNRSFHSADAQHPQQQSQYNTNSGSLIPDLPNHDFTAGSGGQQRVYADLYRGPSPGPNHGPYDARGYGGY